MAPSRLKATSFPFATEDPAATDGDFARFPNLRTVDPRNVVWPR